MNKKSNTNDTCTVEHKEREKFIEEINDGRNTINEDGRLFGGSIKDIAYRHRLVHTTCVCFSVFARVYMCNCLICSCLIDLFAPVRFILI